MLLWRSRFLQGVSFTNINTVWPNLSRIIDVLTSERNTVWWTMHFQRHRLVSCDLFMNDWMLVQNMNTMHTSSGLIK